MEDFERKNRSSRSESTAVTMHREAYKKNYTQLKDQKERLYTAMDGFKSQLRDLERKVEDDTAQRLLDEIQSRNA